jgi:hypothetical protein
LFDFFNQILITFIVQAKTDYRSTFFIFFINYVPYSRKKKALQINTILLLNFKLKITREGNQRKSNYVAQGEAL